MRHTTIDLEQQENGEYGHDSALLQTSQKNLMVLPGAGMVTTTTHPMHPAAIADRTVWAQPAPHAECQCPSCRRRRSRRKGKQRAKKTLPYIEADFIVVTEDPERPPTSVPPLGHATTGEDLWAARRRPGRGTRNLPRWQVSLLIAAVLACFFLAGIGPSLQASLFPPPAATVAIIPSSSRESLSINVTAAVGHISANQVAARILRSASPTRTVVARASGTLIFYNQGPSPQMIGAGVSLTGAEGVTVVTDDAVTVPAGNPPTLGMAEVGAHSVQAGSQANIAAGDIGELCCADGISVKNTAFSGGRDARTYPILGQHDLDLAIASVSQVLTKQAQHQLQGQISGREQLAFDPQCHTSASGTSPAGSHVAQATLSVSTSCTGEAFDRASTLVLAASLFAQEAAKQLGPPYRLTSKITAHIASASLTDARRGRLSISVQAQGIWRYQWSRAAQLAIARRIEGKSVQAALSMLANASGVAHTSISLSGGAQSIPSDLDRITIAIMPAGEAAP